MTMPSKTKTSKKVTKITSTLAKSKDGTIQLTFKVPFKEIKSAREKVATDIGKDLELPGFRKGKAPLEKLLDHIPQNTLIEGILRTILPEEIGKAIREHKLKLAIYPKFELVTANEDEDWQVRGTTCELPEVKLGDYKKLISDQAKTAAIWTPDKQEEEIKSKGKKELTKQEKEQKVIDILLKNTKLEIPRPLVEEEVNRRLADLLQRIEKLGLNLESYLASIGKTAETIRKDYEDQAQEAIKFDLILNKVAEKEKVKVSEKEIEEALKGYSEPGKSEPSPDQKAVVETVLRKRAALDALASLL